MFVQRRDVPDMVARYRQEYIQDHTDYGDKPDPDEVEDMVRDYRRSLQDGYLFWGEFW